MFLNYQINDLVNYQKEKEIYVIREINENLITISGFTHRIKRVVTSDEIHLAKEDDVNKEKKEVEKKKERFIKRSNVRQNQSYRKLLYGRILHIDGDKEFLESCLELYKEMNVPSNGIYLNEKDVKNKIETLLLQVTPDIIVITGHDVYNGNGIKDIENYQNSQNFVDAVREIRKHFNQDAVVTIVGACASHFEALIAAGANFSSSPKRINIHTYDPAILAIKVATTSCNQVVDFNSALEFIENKKDAFGGIETKGKMKILL